MKKFSLGVLFIGGLLFGLSQYSASTPATAGGQMADGFFFVGDNYYWVAGGEKILLNEDRAFHQFKNRVSKDSFSRTALTALDWAVLQQCEVEDAPANCETFLTNRSIELGSLYGKVLKREPRGLFYYMTLTGEVVKISSKTITDSSFYNNIVTNMATETSQLSIDNTPDYSYN